MTRDEKVTRLIQLLKEENPGYAVIEIPDGAEERRRLLRSLMNVRWPGEASPEYLGLQDELLQEEAREKGIVQPEEIPAVWETFPEAELRNGDRIALWQGDITRLAADAIVNAGQQPAAGVFCSLPTAVSTMPSIPRPGSSSATNAPGSWKKKAGKRKPDRPGSQQAITCPPACDPYCWARGGAAGDRPAERRITKLLPELP